MIYALGDVSGAHFNPAVTAAIFSSGRCGGLSPSVAGRFVAAQLAGGFIAALTYSSIYKGDSFPLGPGAGYSWTEVAVAEVLFTFVLCYAVLCVAVSERTKSMTMFSLVIGSCVTVGGNAIGAISGGSLNPAVSAGISMGHIIMGGGGASTAAMAAVFYTVCELFGAVAAAGAFLVTHKVDKVLSKDEGPDEAGEF